LPFSQSFPHFITSVDKLIVLFMEQIKNKLFLFWNTHAVYPL
jgi:hypothetical protein